MPPSVFGLPTPLRNRTGSSSPAYDPSLDFGPDRSLTTPVEPHYHPKESLRLRLRLSSTLLFPLS